jgi:hypothetical protein
MNETLQIPSLGALRAAHTEMLRRRRIEGETPALLREVEALIAAGRAAGALLDNDAERETAQSLLDYWSTVMTQAGRWDVDTTLDDFDPDLAPELPDEPRPYVGLTAFHDGRFFFGRERLVAQMAERLESVRLLAVVGPSGSGKSSAVLAGLIPALGRGILPGSEDWRILPRVVPGSHPLANLARLLTEDDRTRIHADGSGLDGLIGRMTTDADTLAQLLWTGTEDQRPAVLVIDQFEETFTLCTDEAERTAFVANLLGVASAADAPHRLILTMRSDFESWVARFPALESAFARGRIQATPLSAEELRRTIEEPANLVGLRFQQGIVDTLISEVLGEPAALPLLQFTLATLWEGRQRNRITWEVYNRVGGGRTALARAADRLYNDLIPEEQVTARRILLRMVRPGAGLEVTSSRVPIADLLSLGEDPGRVERVLDRLLAARLLKESEGDVAADRQVEVAHEALIRNWPTLVDWLEQERETLRHRRRLTDAAERWLKLNRDPSALLRGMLLEEAHRYTDLTALEAEFVEASRNQVEQEREREIRERIELERSQALAAQQTRRAKQLTRILILLVALLIGIVAIFSYETSKRQPSAWKRIESFPADVVRAIVYSPVDQSGSEFHYCVSTLNVGLACSMNMRTWNIYQQGLPTVAPDQRQEPSMIPQNSRGISAFTIDSMNYAHIYAYFFDSGLLKSENSGLTWQPMGMSLVGDGSYFVDQIYVRNGTVAAIVSNFATPQRSLYLSGNGGVSWTEVLTPTNPITGSVDEILFIPDDHSDSGFSLLIAGQNGLFRGEPGADATGAAYLTDLQLAVDLKHVQTMTTGAELNSETIFLASFDRATGRGEIFSWQMGQNPTPIADLDLEPLRITAYRSPEAETRLYILFDNGRVGVVEGRQPLNFLPDPPTSLFDSNFRAWAIQILPSPVGDYSLFLGHGNGLFRYDPSAG